jgi:error-prone DNA polymerase
MTAYAELQITSNFSFLRGGSHPEELVLRARELGLAALALTDRNTLAGVVRAHVAAKEVGIRFVVGARLDLEPQRRAGAVIPLARSGVSPSGSSRSGPITEVGPGSQGSRGPVSPAPGRGGPRVKPEGDNNMPPARSVLCFPTDRAAYGRLAQLISLGQRRVEKGRCALGLEDLLEHAEGQIVVALPPGELDDGFAAFLEKLRHGLPGCHLAAQRLYRGDDAARIEALAGLAAACRTPLVATGDVLYHAPERRPLQDVLTCIRAHCTIDRAGFRLEANAERHLKPPAEMARLFRRHPEALARTAEIVDACRFSLDELRYDYPIDPTPAGLSVQQYLEQMTWQGAAERYPEGVPAKVRALLEHEFRLIAGLGYAPYFLTVHDIVRFARERGILCQGRGSAANSAICYCLGITAVDPERFDLLFERFVSAERREPPDIDVDFEHERREEVIQYIYAKYGREHAGIAATVIHYRARSAIREVGKAMGLSEDAVGALASGVWGWSEGGLDEQLAHERGLDPADHRLRLALKLASELTGFPRHLSQHVGGFVLTRSRLDQVVPVVNAAMAERTMVEWDKDDLDALGILKIDVLALGMLSCIRKAFELLRHHHGQELDLASVPAEDPAVYAMLSRADSLGVFQVESRAQMTMLPRLRPKRFYDLVIEVAIVRPGPIQGDMVHPYLRRRNGEERVDYPSEALRGVLEKTLGVPLFQEQAMQIAIVGAGFTASESDRLRRAMATFKRVGTIHTFRNKFIDGMVANGYARDFAERCFKQIEGFGTYGFPESHAASFALLVYVSSWLKCHFPEVFACALLNSQPMGFYAPAQIVRDAREHGVAVLPVDVNASAWDCTLEVAAVAAPPAREDGGAAPPADRKGRPFALRLGFRQVKGLREEEMAQLVERRGRGYADLADLRRRAGLSAGALDRLARADAFTSLALDRRGALWHALGLDRTGHELDPPPLFAWARGRPAATAPSDRPPPVAPAKGRTAPAVLPMEPEVALPRMTLGHEVAEDYANLRMSLRAHPLALLRPRLDPRIVKAEWLARIPNGRRVEVAGLTLVRQRPGTASGVIFITLEDESGIANLVVWPKVFERFRRVVLGAQLLLVRGPLQKEGLVIHVIAERLLDRTDLLRRLAETDQALTAPLARADEVKRPGPPDPRDPFFRPRDLDHFRTHPHIYRGILEPPAARAAAPPGPLDPRAAGFKSRNFR